MSEAVVTREHDYRMPYSVGVRVPAGKDLLFVAGTTALPLYHDHPHVLADLEFPREPAEQTREALAGIREVVEGAGGTIEDIVRLDVFITDMAVQDQVARELGRCFPGSCPPAMTLIAVRELVVPGLFVEINAVAALEARSIDEAIPCNSAS